MRKIGSNLGGSILIADYRCRAVACGTVHADLDRPYGLLSQFTSRDDSCYFIG